MNISLKVFSAALFALTLTAPVFAEGMSGKLGGGDEEHSSQEAADAAQAAEAAADAARAQAEAQAAQADADAAQAQADAERAQADAEAAQAKADAMDEDPKDARGTDRR